MTFCDSEGISTAGGSDLLLGLGAEVERADNLARHRGTKV
jgi:hypothetical protein